MSHVTCHMSCVACHVSHITCPPAKKKFFFLILRKLVKGLLSTGPIFFVPKTCWTFIIFPTPVVTLSVAVVTSGLQPLALSVRGQFPGQSPMGKVCLLTPLAQNREKGMPELVKTVAITVAFTFIGLVYVGYITWKESRFLNRMCPNKKMACIGRYKRNVIGYKETAIMFVICSLKGILDVSMFVIFTNYRISPRAAFHLDSIIWLAVYELLPLGFTTYLNSREIPFCSEPEEHSTFYVHSHNKLVPRRPSLPPSLSPSIAPPPLPARKDKGKGKNRTTYIIATSSQHRKTTSNKTNHVLSRHSNLMTLVE